MKNLFAISLLAVLATACGSKYKDKNATPQERAESIVAQMTLEEKVSLMMHHADSIPRLGIRQYNWWNEALHGVGRNGLATVFPQPIGMAASWDDELVYQVFDAVSTEARAKHNVARQEGPLQIYQGLTFWTPNINIFRDPRWGRGHETYGEDPYLTATLGCQVVRGLQGPADAKHNKLHACAKHFAVHSGPEWSRHSYDAQDIDPRDLHETYLPAFKALVQKAGVKEVMCAYNRYEGDPCCGSNRLLQQILRDEWGYQGIVTSDCWAVADFYLPGHHETEPDSAHASARAVRTGTDIECGESYESLVDAVRQGLVSEAEIDRSLVRLMKARYELGEMDDEADVEWSKIPFSVVDCPEHRALASRMAHESMTLLQNRDNLLPLNRDMTIALIGPNANDSVMQWGNYNGFPSSTSTLLSALRERMPEANIIYEPACAHVTPAMAPAEVSALLRRVAKAAVVVFAGGISPQLEGEEMEVSQPGFRGGDRETIELPEVQRTLLRRLHEAGKRVVYVNYSGSCIALPEETRWADAILQAWYPGQAGGEAVADVLLGDYNPAGRLPVTFYASTADLPDFEDYSMQNRTYRYFRGTPVFRFGHGLSYTTFSYGKATLSATTVKPGDTLTLTVPVTNTGQRDGDEVVQVYLSRKGETDGPAPSLRAFRRVPVKAGETVNVALPLTAEQLEWFDTASNAVRLLPGTYLLHYGPSSDPALLQQVEVEVK